jgi:hypothetical protein
MDDRTAFGDPAEAANADLVTFDLVREPRPELAALGPEPQLRELTHGDVKRLMRSAPSEEFAEALLAASLYVDGVPVGLRTLDRAPGHLTLALGEAMRRALELHGLRPVRSVDEAAQSSGAPPLGEP